MSSLQKLLTFFFSKAISIYAMFNDQNFNDTLTNDTISFEQLDPGHRKPIFLAAEVVSSQVYLYISVEVSPVKL